MHSGSAGAYTFLHKQALNETKLSDKFSLCLRTETKEDKKNFRDK